MLSRRAGHPLWSAAVHNIRIDSSVERRNSQAKSRNPQWSEPEAAVSDNTCYILISSHIVAVRHKHGKGRSDMLTDLRGFSTRGTSRESIRPYLRQTT